MDLQDAREDLLDLLVGRIHRDYANKFLLAACYLEEFDGHPHYVIESLLEQAVREERQARYYEPYREP
jgi:hypothetical protein